MTDLVAQFDRLPPFLCRLLARKNRGQRALSHQEIARKSKLAKSTVADLSYRTTWKGQRIEVIAAFTTACGIDPLHPRWQFEYMRRQVISHLNHCGGNERRMYDRLVALSKVWIESHGRGS